MIFIQNSIMVARDEIKKNRFNWKLYFGFRILNNILQILVKKTILKHWFLIWL